MFIFLFFDNNSEKKYEIVSRQDADAKTVTPSHPCSCLTIKEEETSEATSSDSDRESNTAVDIMAAQNGNLPKQGTLVTVDGETDLELETLLKASAYVLGNSRVSIVYKAVLEDGRAFAVRRIGECGIERRKDFENQVRAIAKLRHPNLVKVRGFCWGRDDKLLICDYVPNGSLATIDHSKFTLHLNHFMASNIIHIDLFHRSLGDSVRFSCNEVEDNHFFFCPNCKK